MQHVDEDDIERHPGQVEKGHRSLAAEEAAHRVDVTATLQSLGGGEAEARHVDGDLTGERRDLAIEPAAHPDKYLRADDVEDAWKR